MAYNQNQVETFYAVKFRFASGARSTLQCNYDFMNKIEEMI